MLVVDKAGRDGRASRARQLDGHARERAQGARRPLSEGSGERPRGHRPSARQGDLGSAARRQVGSRAPRARRRAPGAARSAPVRGAVVGPSDRAIGSRWTSRSARDPRDRKRDGGRRLAGAARERISCGWRASTRSICCARTCTPGARTRSACISRRSAIRSSATTRTAAAAGGSSLGFPPQRHFLHAAWLGFTHPVTGRGARLPRAAAGGPRDIAGDRRRRRRHGRWHRIRSNTLVSTQRADRSASFSALNSCLATRSQAPFRQLHRRLRQPPCRRGSACGRRRAGDRVQPAVHLQRVGSRQDAPDGRHRQPRHAAHPATTVAR